MALPGFLYGGNTGETPQSLAKKRAVVEALLMGRGAPKTVGEGLLALGDGIAANVLGRRADAAERQGNESATAAIAALLAGNEFPPAPAASSGAPGFALSDAARDFVANNPQPGGFGADVDSAMAPRPASGGTDVAALESYIREAAGKRGIDPDIAVRVARSEGLAPGVWQSNVVKDGRRETSYGPFQLLVGGGLGDKFQEVYGKSPEDPSTVFQQIDFALDQAAQGGWSPWYGAAKVGVGDWTGLDGARALGFNPTQVASLDPTAGANQALTNQPQSPGNFPLANQPQAAQRVAQAQPQTMTDALPEMAGNAPAQPGGPSLQQLIQAAQNPWLSDSQRAVVSTMLEQRMQQQDPMRQLQLRKLQMEIDQAGNKRRDLINAGDGRIYDPNTESWIVAPSGNGSGGFRFDGNSVEAQALNGLIESGAITVEQAQQLGAGKTITDPSTGAMMFLTPQGVFGQSAGGGAPQPVSPQTRLLSPEPMGGAPSAPAPASRPGVIPLTPGKANMPTDTQRNRKAAVEQSFSALGGELDRYAELVGKTGIEAAPGEAKDNLNAVRQGIMLQLKELFNLGVLNGPDLSLMEKMIYDPVVDLSKEGGLSNLPDQIWTGITGGAGARARNSVAELKRMLANIKASVGGAKSADDDPLGLR